MKPAVKGGQKPKAQTFERKHPLEVLFRTSGPYRVSLNTLETPSGVFMGVRAMKPGIPLGKEVLEASGDGIIAIQFMPCTDKNVASQLSASLKAQLNHLQAKGAPESVLKRYRQAIEDIANNPDKMCAVGIYGIVSMNMDSSDSVGTCPPLIDYFFQPPKLICGVMRIENIPDYLAVWPEQNPWVECPFANTFYGDVIHFPIGKPGNAERILILGPSGSGKSTSAKFAMRSLANIQNVYVVATDMKGEYCFSDHAIFGFSPYHAHLIRYGVGFYTLSLVEENPHTSKDTILRAITLEAFAISKSLAALGYDVQEAVITDLITRGVRILKENPGYGAAKVSQTLFKALMKKYSLPDAGIVRQLFGSPEKGGFPFNFGQQRKNIVVNYALFPYRSETQLATVYLTVPFIIEQAPGTADTLTVFFLEEGHLFPGHYLGTLLRLLRAKNIALVMITQSIEELEKLEGGQEQFTYIFYFNAAPLNVQRALKTLFGFENYSPPHYIHELTNTYGLTRRPGHGMLLTSTRLVIPMKVVIPPVVLEEIDEFNRKANEYWKARRRDSLVPHGEEESPLLL